MKKIAKPNPTFRLASICLGYIISSSFTLLLIRWMFALPFSFVLQYSLLSTIVGCTLHFFQDLVEYKGIRVKAYEPNRVYVLVPGKLSSVFQWLNPLNLISLLTLMDDSFLGYTFPYTAQVQIRQLTTLLRMKNVPFEIVPIQLMNFGEQLPVIELDGRPIHRLDRIVQVVYTHFRLQSAVILGNKDQFIAKSLSAMLSAHFMPIALHFKLKTVPSVKIFSSAFNVFRFVYTLITRFQVRSAFQFIGMVSPDERDDFLLFQAEEDISLLSELLAKRKYLFGMTPSIYDTTALAYLEFAFEESPALQSIMRKYPNLLDYMKTLREDFGSLHEG